MSETDYSDIRLTVNIMSPKVICLKSIEDSEVYVTHKRLNTNAFTVVMHFLNIVPNKTLVILSHSISGA